MQLAIAKKLDVVRSRNTARIVVANYRRTFHVNIPLRYDDKKFVQLVDRWFTDNLLNDAWFLIDEPAALTAAIAPTSPTAHALWLKGLNSQGPTSLWTMNYASARQVATIYIYIEIYIHRIYTQCESFVDRAIYRAPMERLVGKRFSCGNTQK